MTPIQAPDASDPKWSERLWFQTLALLAADLVAVILIASLLLAITKVASLLVSPEHQKFIVFIRDAVVLSAIMLGVISVIALSYRRSQLIRAWRASRSAGQASAPSDDLAS